MRRFGAKPRLTEADSSDPNHSLPYAIALLARRDYSSRDLRQKLAERGYLEHAIEPVVEELIASGKVNDERFGQNVVAYRAGRGQGPARIRQQLQKSGLGREAVDEAVKGGDAPDFASLARVARARKFGPDLPQDHKSRAKQARFLQYRGFSTDHIRAALDGDPELDSDADAGGESDPS